MKKKQRAVDQSFTLSKTGLAGTLLFMAPEMFGISDLDAPDHKMTYTNKIDVYSFGITLAGTINGKQPYVDQFFSSQFDFARRVLGGLRPNVVNAGGMPSDLITLMEQCWDADPDNRPSFEVIVTKLREILSSFQK